MTVALFITCITDTFFPRVGEAVVRVLRHFGCRVEFPDAQTCCGQPAFSGGAREDAAAVARRMIEVFQSYPLVVTPSASCASMVKHHFAELFEHEPEMKQAAERLAARTHEFVQFLTDVLRVPLERYLQFDRATTFHYPCHARKLFSCGVLEATLRPCGPETLVAPRHADLCCGFGGAFAAEYAEVSGAMLRDKLDALRATGAELVVCNEGGCGLQILGGARRAGDAFRVRHVAELLAEALGLMEARP